MQRHSVTWLYRAAAVLSIVLFGAGIAVHREEASPPERAGGVLQFDALSKSCGEVANNSQTFVTFAIMNRGGRVHTILGASST